MIMSILLVIANMSTRGTSRFSGKDQMLFVRSFMFCLLFVWLAMPAYGQRMKWSPTNYPTTQHSSVSLPTQSNWSTDLPVAPDRAKHVDSREPVSNSPDSWAASSSGSDFPVLENWRPNSLDREFNGGLRDSDPLPTPSVPDLKTQRSFSNSRVIDPAGRFSETRDPVSKNGPQVFPAAAEQRVRRQAGRSRYPLDPPDTANPVKKVDFQTIESPTESGFKNVEDWYAPPSTRGAVNNALESQPVENPQPQNPNSQSGFGWGPMNPTPGQQLFDPQRSDFRSDTGHRSPGLTGRKFGGYEHGNKGG